LFVFLIARDDEEPSKMLRVCYITNWSRYRSGEAKFEIEFVDPFMCSHIIYAYATVDDRKPEIIPIQKDDLGSKKILKKKISLLLIFFRTLSRTCFTKKNESKFENIYSIRRKNFSIYSIFKISKYGYTTSSKSNMVILIV